MTSPYAAFVQEHPRTSHTGPSPPTTGEWTQALPVLSSNDNTLLSSISTNPAITKSKSLSRVSFSDRPIEYASSSTDIDDDPQYSDPCRYRSNSEQSVDSVSSERTTTNTAINATTSAAPCKFIGAIDNNLNAQFEAAAAIDDGLVTTNEVQRQPVVTIQILPDLPEINKQLSSQIWEIQEEQLKQQQNQTQHQKQEQQQPQQQQHQTHTTTSLNSIATISWWYRLLISTIVSVLVLAILACWFPWEGSTASMGSSKWHSVTRSLEIYQPKYPHHPPPHRSSLSVLSWTTTVRFDDNIVMSCLYWLKQQLVEHISPFDRHRHRHKVCPNTIDEYENRRHLQ